MCKLQLALAYMAAALTFAAALLPLCSTRFGPALALMAYSASHVFGAAVVGLTILRN